VEIEYEQQEMLKEKFWGEIEDLNLQASEFNIKINIIIPGCKKIVCATMPKHEDIYEEWKQRSTRFYLSIR
jgi:hypothetical protein